MHKYNIYRHIPSRDGTDPSSNDDEFASIDFDALSRSFPSTFGVEYRALQARRRAHDDRRDASDVSSDPVVAASAPRGTSSFSTHVTPGFLRALTSALLRRDFGLEHFHVPPQRLCPPVPGRLNYVCWIRELLEEKRCVTDSDVVRREKRRRREVSAEAVHGIDIGTGASAIFAILGVRQGGGRPASSLPPWYFLATEVDALSLEAARKNVSANGMEGRIAVVAVRRDVGPVAAALAATSRSTFDFSMCNPPFYATEEEAQRPRRGDGRDRTEMCAMEAVHAPGGEVAFVSAMVDDSLVHRKAVGWYTSMLGKKKSLTAVVQKLRQCGFTGRAGNVRTTTFEQGRSVRWGVAWTFYEGPARTLDCRLATRRFVVPGENNGSAEVVRRLLQYSAICVRSQDPMRVHPLRSTDTEGHDIITLVGVGARAVELPGALESTMDREVRWCTIDATVISQTEDYDGDTMDVSMTDMLATEGVEVRVECYLHVEAGRMAALGIADRMEGEVCRTNRRWRRVLAKKGDTIISAYNTTIGVFPT
mmetsp:Transcript_40545/g.95196  ORF Transcript_40545/g.95196 Transcript_40545/m.95196 type:complete len:535 (-) Transcript_40545:56-1660(-)